MPSIEIICIGQKQPTEFTDAPFRVFAENRLVSHRSPHPLFQSDFDALTGCIYHLLNPEKGYTAYKLLDSSPDRWPSEDRPDKDSLIWGIYFFPEYAPYVHKILSDLLKASPEGKVLFTSDYQFGPKVQRYKTPITLDVFWKMHDEGKLKMNALYSLYSPLTSA